MADIEREHALRAHVHALLHAYAITHLTTDYLAFTYEAVNDVLSESLYTISENDPNSLALDPTLSELISGRLKLSELEDYQERLSVDHDARAHLRNFFRSTINDPKDGDTRSDTSWLEDDEASPWQLLSPVLTMRAIRQTPKLLGKPASQSVAGPTVSLLNVHNIGEIEIELGDLELLKQDMRASNLNEILGHKLAMDTDTRSAVVNCIREARMQPRVGEEADEHVNAFIQGEEDDLPEWRLPQLASPPLFSRDQMPGGKLPATSTAMSGICLTGFQELGSLLPPAQADSDDSCDLYKEHMAAINGWETYHIPSSPTPSLQSSSSEGVDELDLDQYLPSSSPGNLTKFCDRFLPAKMDEHLIPRSESMGDAQVKIKTADNIERLSSLLSFLQPVPKTSPSRHTLDHAINDNSQVKVVTTAHSEESSPSTSITTSMLGQPPTAPAIQTDLGVSAVDLDDLSSDDLGLNKVLKAMYRREDPFGKTGGIVIDPRDYILKERLDDKECYLMDVPDLPPPNEHPPSGTYMPTTMRALLPSKDGAVEHLETAHGGAFLPDNANNPGFLHEVKGLKSLNMELGWRPFNYGTSMPTDEEVSRLTDNVKAECLLDLMPSPENKSQPWTEIEDHLSQLLADFSLSGGSEVDERNAAANRVWLEEDLDPGYLMFCDDGYDDVILTATDRRRAAGLPDVPRADSETPMSDEESSAIDDGRPVKRLRFSSPVIFEYTPAQSFEYSQPQALDNTELPPTDDYLEEVEDSGVFIPETFDTQHRVGRFGRLTEEAEGFEGPADDGEIILDVDPLLMEDWMPHSPAAITESPFLPHGFNYPWAEEPHGSGVTDEAGNFSDDVSEVLALTTEVRERDAPNSALNRGPICNHNSTTAPVNNTMARTQEDDHDIGQSTEPSRDRNYLLPGRSARQNLYAFMKLRSKKVTSSLEAAAHPPISPVLPIGEPSCQSFEVPPELVNNHTLTLSSARSWPSTPHRYLASLDFIQKRGLVRMLSLPQCAVQLTEREYLDGPDIVLDCDTAVLFSPLRTLPTQCDVLTAALSKLSWRFSWLLVVFESFPATGSHNHADNQTDFLTVNPFSPPVVKAVRKLRRDIGIAEACHDKRTEAVVNFAFPLTLVDAARTIRLYGDLAQQRDITSGALWDDRRWLDVVDEDLDERDLAAIDGMNVFAAAVILTNTTLDDFLDRTPEERSQQFGSLIGRYRVDAFNAIIARRREAMELPSSSPPITSNTSSKATTPMETGLVESYTL